MPSAPLSVSTQSRNKLQTYIFEVKAVDNVGDHNKENISEDRPGSCSVAGSQKPPDSGLNKSSPQLPQLPAEKQCPQTPVNKIPLADLIGNTEDAFNCDLKDTTPEDHIYWQHGPTPRSSIPSASAASTRKGKKRARSSSPASSSQNQKSAHFNGEETLDLKIFQESLKTPQNDPALDLWARYTNASLTKTDTDGNALPAFAHLMTSSPQTPSTTGKDSGLRRSISCGIEWPTSKTKRRKFNPELAEGEVRDIFAASKRDIMAREKPKASRISLLMEKLQENSMRVPQIEVSGPSSSSPLPGRNGMPAVLEVSPVSKRSAVLPANDDIAADEDDNGPMQDVDPPMQDDHEDQSSEFGDEDLGLDILEAVETQAGISAPQEADLPGVPMVNDTTDQDHAGRHEQPYKPASSHRHEAGKALSPSENVEVDSRKRNEIVPTAVAGDDDDEFGDGSDDNGAMADLAAQFDTQQSTCGPPQYPQQQGTSVQQGLTNIDLQAAARVLDDDEAYDDDDDLWNQIGDGSLVVQQGNSLANASQVRVIL